jgi:hypothetical protein
MKYSINQYHELRNKIWEDLVASGVSSDEDENFKAFDGVLGGNLPVDWSWDETSGSDICYGCGTAQQYLTMPDVVEDSFAIYCDKCHPAAKALKELTEILEAIDASSGTDWDENDASMEFDYYYGELHKVIENLKKSLDNTD